MGDSEFITDVSLLPFKDEHTQAELDFLQNDINVFFLPKHNPLEMNKEIRVRAEEELHENPDRLLEEIQQFRELIASEEKGLNGRMDDMFLAAFLRGKKHDMAKALQCYKNFYDFKHRYPEFYSYLIPSEQGYVFNLDHFGSLPGVDRKGRKICAAVPAKVDPDNAPVADTFKLGASYLELMLNDLHLQVTGTVIIFDLAEFSLLHQIKLATPTNAWHLTMVAQDKIPLRVKAVHIINQPFYFNALYAVFKPFLKKKLKKRIFLHGNDMKSLHKHIAPEHLPEEWGGTRPPFSNFLTKSLMYLNEHKLHEWSKYDGYGS